MPFLTEDLWRYTWMADKIAMNDVMIVTSPIRPVFVELQLHYAEGFGPLPAPEPAPLPKFVTRHKALPAQCLSMPDAACFMRGR